MRGYACVLLALLMLGIPFWAGLELWLITTTQVNLTRILIAGLFLYSLGSVVFAYIVATGVESRLRPAARAILHEHIEKT
jgi:hypothetical protein